jgi:hypothetical protein
MRALPQLRPPETFLSFSYGHGPQSQNLQHGLRLIECAIECAKDFPTGSIPILDFEYYRLHLIFLPLYGLDSLLVLCSALREADSLRLSSAQTRVPVALIAILETGR